MSSSPFIAILKRLPGGKGIKVPRNSSLHVQAPCKQNGIPNGTRTDNLCTYFRPWPKHFTTFLNYGSTRPELTRNWSNPSAQNVYSPTRAFSTTAPSPSSLLNSTLLAQGHGESSEDLDPLNLYGGRGGEIRAEIGNENNNHNKKPASRKKIGLPAIAEKHRSGNPLTMITAYDAPTGGLADRAGMDMILVGDSLSMTVMGLSTTTQVTMEEMVHHCRCVSRGAKHPLLVGDMPFGSYLTSDDAVRNAAKLIKEGRMDAVKLEGGKRVAKIVRSVVDAGIPVIGHIGLTPQTPANSGGFVLQGKTSEAAMNIYEDALELQRAGAFAIVLEMVPTAIAKIITEKLQIPTIGIGAGNGTSGQVLVFHDMIGYFPTSDGEPPKLPRFVKRYASVGQTIEAALRKYCEEVHLRSFPGPSNSFSLPQKELDVFKQKLGLEIDTKPPMILSPSNTQSNPGIMTPLYPSVTHLVPNKQESKDAEISKETFRKLVVIGGGSMGSLFAAKLALSKDAPQVWLLSNHEKHVRQIRSSGKLLLGAIVNGKELIEPAPVRATSNPAEVFEDKVPIDGAIVLVKNLPHANAVAAKRLGVLASSMRDPRAVLNLQNGFSDDFANESKKAGFDGLFLRGVTSQSAILQSLGLVMQTGNGPTTIFSDSPAALGLARLIQESGLNGELIQGKEDFQRVLWRKLVANCVINPLTAIYNVPNGELMKSEFLPLIQQIVFEVARVASELGIKSSFGNGEESLAEESLKSTLEIIKATDINTSSMCCDVRRGVSTEVNSLNGFVVREANRLGVGVPLNQRLVDLISSLEPQLA